MFFRFFNKILAFIFLMIMSSASYAEVVIGFMAPLTGPSAPYGLLAQEGLRAAVEDLNNKGGILGQKISIKYLDDAGEARQAVSVVNQAAADNIHYIIGPMVTTSALAIYQLLKENGILSITPTCTTNELTEHGAWNIFRTVGRDDQQGVYAAQYVVNNLNGKRIAILHDKSSYGYGLVQSFRSELNRLGLKDVFFGSINVGEKDYSSIASRLKSLKVDFIYYGGYYTEAGLLIRQLRTLGSSAVFIGADGFNSEQLWSIARNSAQGTLFTNSSPIKKNQEIEAILDSLKKRNISQSSFSLSTYAALQILVQAIEKANTLEDPEKVASLLKQNENIFNSLIGSVQFDNKGDLKTNSWSMYKWDNGKIVPVM